MKYIYIDSNQYRHLFSLSEGFSDEVFQLLLNLIDTKHITLVLPQQTKEEVERNRFRAWPENAVSAIENKIKKLDDSVDRLQKDFGVYRGYHNVMSDIQKAIKGLRKEKDEIYSNFTHSRSKANQKLKQLFNRAELIEETNEIQNHAGIRNQKGNPPYDNGGIGDCLIWESLLAHLPNRAQLIFVSNDNKAWGDEVFDLWLQKEFKKRINGKLIYSNKLADIPELTVDEQKKIRSEELSNLKQNAISDFVNSPSFVGAGERAHKLMEFKSILTSDDYKEIVKASLTNHEIYQSFFTQIPLRDLVTGENGYADKRLELIDLAIWRQFCEKYSISVKRQTDQQELRSTEININDTPF